MLNKKNLLNKIDEFISSGDDNLTSDQVKELKTIKSNIEKSVTFADVSKWLFELLKLMGAFKALFFDS